MAVKMTVSNAQTITPQMIQSVSVLQCGTQELKEHLEELCYGNPMMELQEPDTEQAEQAAQSALLDRLRWIKGSDRQNGSYYSDADRDSVDQYLSEGQSECLGDFLREQILTMDVSEKLRHAMEMVVELLDERGLYTGTVSEISRLARCPASLAREALNRVRQLEPAGVAAGSVADALLAQLIRTEPRRPLAEALISSHFSHLASWSDARLARETGVSIEEIQAEKRMLATLNPFPGNGFSSRRSIQYVTPDLYILATEEGLSVTAEERYLPTVRISGEYLKMLDTEQDREVRKYLQQKLGQVEQMIADVERRKSTVLRCGEVIALRQQDFFAGGQLRTLTLQDVADALELHTSTVSRAVRNKYVQCQRGLYPMAYFFQREAGRNYGVCRSEIQTVIKDIVRSENPARPLSDEKIAAELAAKHISLSRRAVAKYRQELGIPSASARKNIGS